MPPTTEFVDPVSAARSALASVIEQDRPAVDALVGRWVPQISAKRDGTEWEGLTYDLPRILSLHEGFAFDDGALLVDGAEYNFMLNGSPMVGWYISIVDVPFADPQGALDWCVAFDFDADNCAAKLITNDQAITPTFVTQDP